MGTEKASSSRIIFFLLVILSFLTITKSFCPHPEDTYPCRCVLRQPPWLFCGGPKITVPDIQKAINASLKVLQGFSLNIKNVHLGKINGYTLEGKAFMDAIIEDCTIDGIVRASKREEMQLEKASFMSLEIINSLHGDVEIDLSSIMHVNHLSLTNNVIKTLEIEWPKHSMGIVSIQLANNSIERVDEDTLGPLTDLNYLHMSGNRLQTLRQELRPIKAHGLQTVDFSHNEISTVSKYYFYDMPNLRHVSLSYNNIQVIGERTWMNVWSKLKYINLAENPLSCGDEIKWIKGQQPEKVIGTCFTPADKKSKNLAQVIAENNPPEKYLPVFLQKNEKI